ncbi:MAG: hypothetical protein NVS2B12_40970 [Ktedonobacteraceae bacterium]
MDNLLSVAAEIARQVAPGEIHDVPLIVENFARGGRARKALLRQEKTGEPGGFGIPVDASTLAWIFHALTIASPYLAGFLAARTVDNFEVIVKAILAALQAPGSAPAHRAQLSQLDSGPSSSPGDHPAIISQQLRLIVDVMTAALQKAGFVEAESRVIAYKVVLVLWQDAPHAIAFLQKITEKK